MTPPAGRHWRYPPTRLDELAQRRVCAHCKRLPPNPPGRTGRRRPHQVEPGPKWIPAGNPRKIRYASDAAGKLPQDIWHYKDPQRPAYPTQKKARLLERIIRASSNPGDAVIDCYAGSGTTLLAAARLGRRFIGMDDSPAAHQVIAKRLRRRGIQWQELV